jgi:ubiquinone/menaquinone biosynthesis C-methylase UbiE
MGILDRFLRRKPQAASLTPDLAHEIRRSFEDSASDEEHFPSDIDPRILHVRLILETLGDLKGKRVLDIGCGKGRFSKIVAARHPGATVVSMDLAVSMLRYAPPHLARIAGSMLQLPFQSSSLDGAWATESLEHAVDVDTAVAEICRVLRPGAPLIIIDKNAEHWGRLETPAWEKWFHREELERLLRKHCRKVSSQPISYWDDVDPDGLFLAWIAFK